MGETPGRCGFGGSKLGLAVTGGIAVVSSSGIGCCALLTGTFSSLGLNTNSIPTNSNELVIFFEI